MHVHRLISVHRNSFIEVNDTVVGLPLCHGGTCVRCRPFNHPVCPLHWSLVVESNVALKLFTDTAC